MTYTHKTGVYALYLVAMVVAAVLYFALEGTDLCGNTPTSRYVVNLVCIAVTAAAVFVVVSWEKLGFVARQLQSPNESTVHRAVRIVFGGRARIFVSIRYGKIILIRLYIYYRIIFHNLKENRPVRKLAFEEIDVVSVARRHYQYFKI